MGIDLGWADTPGAIIYNLKTGLVHGASRGKLPLTDEEVRAIRADTRSLRAIGLDYSISRTQVSHVQKGRIYGEVK